MAAQSIAPSKITDNPIGSAGVRMVESVPILDTSDEKYTKIINETLERINNSIKTWIMLDRELSTKKK
jgi:hypothetical protein